MKTSFVCFVFLVVSFLITPGETVAQSTAAARPASEQSLQDLVNEVRELRATLQRINSAMYKGQVLLERYKLQQEQVARISRELAEARDKLSEMRAERMRLKEWISKIEAGVETGVKHPSELATIKVDLEALREREPKLEAREAQLANELELERAKLNDLNNRLNALELELAPGKP